MWNTEVQSIHSEILNRDYELFVAFPDSYKENTSKQYPVMFVTDAEYAFPLTRSITRRVSNHGDDLQEFILVGLAYSTGDTPSFSRKRDYTPTPNGDHDPSDMPGKKFVFGESRAYAAFIKDEVFPFIQKNYRADMSHKIFVGHSYGGLLGMDIVLSDPTMFQYYIIGSPSLYYDNFYMKKREADYAATHRDLPANIYMATGGFEAPGPTKRNSRRLDMVKDMQDMASSLKSRNYPNLHLTAERIDDEDHLTVFPSTITRGLFWSLRTEKAKH